jgi:AcrR family transcriptional regulator
VDPVDLSPAPNGWDRRRQRVTREIERAALLLFAQRSPDDVTIEQIAAAAAVSIRTFFRYFATRDDVLSALPRRELERITQLVLARPRSETLIEAFAAAGKDAPVSAEDRELMLLWGIVVSRSPEDAAVGLGRSGAAVADSFRSIVADRLDIAADDPQTGALAAALAGLVFHTYTQWVQDANRRPLGEALAEAFTSLEQLHVRRVASRN